jgi:hypothetical protein
VHADRDVICCCVCAGEALQPAMVDAYDHGVVHPEDWEKAMRCKVLDKLDEFALLMRH